MRPVTSLNFSGWDTEFDNVTENITVKAKYEEQLFKVTLVAENGTILTNEEDPFDINTVPYGYTLHLTAEPDEGYEFDHWKNFNPETGLIVTRDTTVTAYFAKLHTVAFVDWDEKEISTQQVKNGSQATAPDDPTREGYTFLGWLSSANGQTMSATDINATAVTADVTYTAQYQGGPYQVTLVAEHGEIEVLNSGIDLNAVPENTVLELVWYTTEGGYKFDHWTNYNEETGLVVTSDTTVTAHFVMQTYTVTFLDWDETVLKEETVDWGGKVTAPADPTREGYTFTGWDTNEYIEVYDNITVHAQYQQDAVVHTLSFVDWNGDKIIDVKVVDGDNPLVPENPTREGYTFIGWLSSETSEIMSALEIGLNIVSADVTYTAQYEKSVIYHTVTFIDWNGDELYKEQVEDGKDAKGPDENPTREGYNFTGWSKPLTNITADRIIVAQYEVATVYYTVTYLDWNGDLIYSESVEEGKDAKGPDENPTREGYNFTGWSKPLTNITADRTVIAQYEKEIVYDTVTFKDWDGSTIATVKVEESKFATAPSDPTREGYTFTGWDKDFSNVTSDLTVTAQYTINVYTVTFIDKDGNTLKTEEVEHGKSATAPDAPAVEGYTFTGWDKAFDKVTSDLTVKAQYAINTYSVTFVDWDGAVLRSAQVVEYGAAAIPPSNPSREGYTFTGWDKDFSNVKSDLTVTAQYTINVYTVTFLDKDGKTLKTESVEYGKSATAPDAPVVEGWTFAGWDKAFNVVKSDLTVQATYTQNPVYTVTFVDWDGSIIATVKVEEGKSAVKPDDPIREGYTFIGWDKEFDNVTSDLTVTALYEEIIVVDYTPTNLSVVVEALGDDDQQITLSWNAVDGAASYDLRLLLGDKELYAGNTFGMHVISLKLSEILQIATIEPGTYSLDWFVRSTDDKAQAISDWAQGETFEVTVKDPGQGIEDINANANANARKEMRNGLLYILRGGRTYDSNGKLIQ